MRASTPLLSAAAMLGLSLPAFAQGAEFSLTYHVERTPAAQQAGLSSDAQSFPGQLVTVRGGAEGKGAFVVQCIAVENMTVSVVQGIDYRGQKGALGEFADQAFAAVKAAVD